MRFTTSIFPFLASLVLARPASVEPQLLHVTDFQAFLSNNNSGLSYLFFHVRDTRTGNEAEANCMYVTNQTDELESGIVWKDCDLPDPEFNFEFGFKHGSLQVKRPFLLNTEDPNSWAAAWSDYQDGNWTEGTNATTTEAGILYSRIDEWEFPLTTMVA